MQRNLSEQLRIGSDLDDALVTVEEELNNESLSNHHFHIGSAEQVCFIGAMETKHAGDPAFKDFQKKLGDFLMNFLLLHNFLAPGVYKLV